MQDVLLEIGKYLWRVLFITSEQLLILLGPALMLAFIMHLSTIFIGKMQVRVVKSHFLNWFGAPGVVVHEVGHAFFCIVFGHKITRMKIFEPNPQEDTLGYVEHIYDPDNLYHRIGNFFIGTGPIWFGTAVLYLMSYFILDASVFNAIYDINISIDTLSSWSGFLLVGQKTLSVIEAVVKNIFSNPHLLTDWKFYVFIYLTFVIGSHITLSPPDIKGAVSGFITLVIVLLVFNFFTSFMGDFSIVFVRHLSKTYTVFLGFMLYAIVMSILISLILLVLSIVDPEIWTVC
jgi:hypothetical protein